MDKTIETMIKNLKDKTGRSLEEWMTHLAGKSFQKHGEFMTYLKKDQGLSHGFANFITHKARQSDAASSSDTELIESQYRNKEHFKPLYEEIIKRVMAFGSDVNIAPKKAYVSLRAKKQFAMLKPATKSRFEIGLNLDNPNEHPDLITISKASSMFSHQVNVTNLDELTEQMVEWLHQAYIKAS